MTREIKILKSELQKLYVKDKLSSWKIARLYGCHQTTILSKLSKFGIEKRKPKQLIKISKEGLEKLYWKWKLSTYKIAELYNCTAGTILRKLREHGIKTRSPERIFITKQKLEKLYLKDKLPLRDISKKYNCSPAGIFKIMKKYKIPLRKSFETNIIHPRNNFSGDKIEKTYMIGFRIGDLNVTSSNSGNSVRIKCNTTRKEQIELFKQVFSKYGYVWIGNPNNKGTFNVEVTLNQSFNFLAKKEDTIPLWILESKKYFTAFLAGYIDAEGSIGIYSGRARCRIGSYDKDILHQIHTKLNSLGVFSTINLEGPKNTRRKGDFWRVNINSKDSLLKLFNLIEPQLKHPKRVNDMRMSQENIRSRSRGDFHEK